jgi:pSer/pThr/pTyr-binding forkhead associated (FHA) protein
VQAAALPVLSRQVADAGSLNGTLLNGTRISIAGRRRGAAYRLNSDDLLQLGTSTAIKARKLLACARQPATLTILGS